MRCPSCGRFSEAEGGFCIYCGSRMPLPTTSISESDVKRLREQLVPIVNDRGRTDVQVSPFTWVIIPFIALLIAVVVTMTLLMTDIFASVESGYDDAFGPITVYMAVFYAATTAIYIVWALLVYKLVKRHNEHFARERRFRDAIMSFSERSAGTMFHYSTPANAETERSPVLWAGVIASPMVLSLIGTVALMGILSADDPDIGIYAIIALAQGILALLFLVAEFYLLYFLTVEMANHHKRWNGFVRETKVLFGRAGYAAGGLSEPVHLPERSIVLYVILSLLTGLFVIYWMYSILKDGNRHFEHHRHFENQLIALLSTRPAEPGDQNASISWA